MERKHHYFLDYIRVIATCFVVFMHSASTGLRFNPGTPGENWHLLNGATSLAFCAVPLFFMMSGYLLFTSSRTPDVPYLLKKRLPRLLVPLLAYTFLSAVGLSLISEEGFRVTTVLNIFAKADSNPSLVHFWFMYTLIAMYLISPFLHGALNSLHSGGKKYLFWLIVTVVGITSLVMVLPTGVRSYIMPYRYILELHLFNSYIFPLLLGWLLGQMERKIPNKILIAVAVIDWAFIVFMTFRLTVSNNSYTATFQAQNRGFELLLAVCIFLLFKQNLNRPLGKVNRWITPIASLTFPIYLVHNLLISVLRKLGFPCITAPQVLALTLVVLIVSYLLVKTAATIKPLCFLCTGLPYEEACRTCNWVYTFRRRKEPAPC